MVWAHSHSTFSTKDALPQVRDMVARAVELDYPALGLTDHGNMGGTVQLYRECRKAGIEPMPGLEAYVAFDRVKYAGRQPETFHLGMLATTNRGYRNLVALHNMSHRNFYYKPMLDLEDLASAAEAGLLDDVFAMSGCWFGLGPKMMREGDPRAVSGLLKALAGWFGGGFAIEIQHHQIKDDEHDDDLHVMFLHTLSEQLGLPTIITQDSHYVHRNERADHDMLKWLASWGTPGDGLFPGELGYHMVSFDEVRHLYPDRVWDKAMAGLDDLAARAKVVIPELDKFQMRVPDVTTSGSPEQEMLDRVLRSFEAKVASGAVPKSKVGVYEERIAAELAVVNVAGFAGYLMLATVICDELTRRNILWAPRGSASGSLLCWLLDITTFDPIKWNLRFDRFLSSDRTKPPDIDIDMDPEYRDEMIEWLQTKFHVLRVGLWSKYALREEDDDLYDPDNPQRGSLPSAYWHAIGKLLELEFGSDKKRWPKRAHDQLGGDIKPEDWRKLQRLDRFRSYKNYGAHAAGLVISGDEEDINSLPQIRTGSGIMVSAFDKDDVELMGAVKFDLLNLKFLTALRIMRDITGVDPRSIKLTESRVYTAISNGRTTGVFQLEGGATANGIRRLRPRKISEVIAAMALFRPATMDSGATDDYIKRRAGEQAIPERHPLIMATTKDTYGVLLYQEQAIEVFRMLGMSIEEIEKARKAIKASNANVGAAGDALKELMVRVHELAEAKGMNEADMKWLESTLEAFAGYSFNLAHATAYGVWAYISAWYSIHHPVAFWAGMLHAHRDSQETKVRKYLATAHAHDVPIRSPHVNVSGVSYTVDKHGTSIYKGLTSIKGVGPAAAQAVFDHAPFTSLDDFATRVPNRTVSGSKNLGLGVAPEDCGGIVSLLHKAGALKGLGWEETT